MIERRPPAMHHPLSKQPRSVRLPSLNEWMINVLPDSSCFKSSKPGRVEPKPSWSLH